MPNLFYVASAREAVRLVKAAIPIATNRRPVGEDRQRYADEMVSSARRMATRHGDTAEDIAYSGVHYGAGNCREQSRLAYLDLKDRLPGVQVEVIAAEPKTLVPNHPANGRALIQSQVHSFVVIARGDGLPSIWSHWSPDAVICDPWAGGVFTSAREHRDAVLNRDIVWKYHIQEN